MSEEEDPWRERGRAALVGLILAFGVVAMVLLQRRNESPADEWPSVAGLYEVTAECRGCGCELADAEGLAAIHPGLPSGNPVPTLCESPDGCVAIMERRAPPNVRAPVVLESDSDPELVTRELQHGPPLGREGEGFGASVTRERRTATDCVRVRRSRELTPLPDGGWHWIERYDSGEGAECPPEGALSCIGSVYRRITPLGR